MADNVKAKNRDSLRVLLKNRLISEGVTEKGKQQLQRAAKNSMAKFVKAQQGLKAFDYLGE